MSGIGVLLDGYIVRALEAGVCLEGSSNCDKMKARDMKRTQVIDD